MLSGSWSANRAVVVSAAFAGLFDVLLLHAANRTMAAAAADAAPRIRHERCAGSAFPLTRLPFTACMTVTPLATMFVALPLENVKHSRFVVLSNSVDGQQ
jgi:hypothetical protein